MKQLMVRASALLSFTLLVSTNLFACSWQSCRCSESSISGWKKCMGFTVATTAFGVAFYWFGFGAPFNWVEFLGSVGTTWAIALVCVGCYMRHVSSEELQGDNASPPDLPSESDRLLERIVKKSNHLHGSIAHPTTGCASAQTPEDSVDLMEQGGASSSDSSLADPKGGIGLLLSKEQLHEVERDKDSRLTIMCSAEGTV